MDSGLNQFSEWIKKHSWNTIVEIFLVDEKVEQLYALVNQKVDECFPQKTLKFTSDDSPWCNDKVKNLKRLKGREYNKHRASQKWLELDRKYKLALVQAKQKYYTNIVKDLKLSNPSQWYSKLKRICSYDQ